MPASTRSDLTAITMAQHPAFAATPVIEVIIAAPPVPNATRSAIGVPPVQDRASAGRTPSDPRR
jgi:hypothetical protein